MYEITTYLPNRDELSLRTVLALPKPDQKIKYSLIGIRLVKTYSIVVSDLFWCSIHLWKTFQFSNKCELLTLSLRLSRDYLKSITNLTSARLINIAFSRKGQIKKFHYPKLLVCIHFLRKKLSQVLLKKFFFSLIAKSCKTDDISVNHPEDNLTPVILGWITDVTAHSAYMHTDAKLKLYSTNAVPPHTSIVNNCRKPKKLNPLHSPV